MLYSYIVKETEAYESGLLNLQTPRTDLVKCKAGHSAVL